jgi:hypothetical protein
MMKPLRTSIATLGACVALIALNLAFLRFQPTNERAYLALFSLPMVNLLAVAFYLGRARRLGGSGPFLRWFQVVGWVAVASYLAWSLNRPLGVGGAIAVATHPVYRTALNNLGCDAMKRLDPSFVPARRVSGAIQLIAAAAFVTGVLLLPAAIGGMTARHRHRKRGGGAMPVARPVSGMGAGR